MCQCAILKWQIVKICEAQLNKLLRQAIRALPNSGKNSAWSLALLKKISTVNVLSCVLSKGWFAWNLADFVRRLSGVAYHHAGTGNEMTRTGGSDETEFLRPHCWGTTFVGRGIPEGSASSGFPSTNNPRSRSTHPEDPGCLCATSTLAAGASSSDLVFSMFLQFRDFRIGIVKPATFRWTCQLVGWSSAR